MALPKLGSARSMSARKLEEAQARLKKDLRGCIPSFIHISEGKLHDVNVLDLLLPEPGAIYVMDRGYLDFSRLYLLHQAAAFFVTRAKSNIDARRLYSAPSDRANGIICDQTIVLADTQTSQLYPGHLTSGSLGWLPLDRAASGVVRRLPGGSERRPPGTPPRGGPPQVFPCGTCVRARAGFGAGALNLIEQFRCSTRGRACARRRQAIGGLASPFPRPQRQIVRHSYLGLNTCCGAQFVVLTGGHHGCWNRPDRRWNVTAGRWGDRLGGSRSRCRRALPSDR